MNRNDELANLIAEFVPSFVLLEISHPDVKLDVEKWLKEAAGAEFGKLDVAVKIVEAFDEINLRAVLAQMLYRRFFRDDLLAVKFVPFAKELGNDNLQASLAYRALMLQQLELREFLSKCEPRVCLILVPCRSGNTNRGTGFLVGPDRILTAWHVVGSRLNDLQNDPDLRCWAVFDHITGPALTSIDDIPNTARKVMFAENWRASAVTRKSLSNDGTFADPSEAEIIQLRENLDFALVQLAEPVGRETTQRNGGGRRGWFTYGELGKFPKLQVDARIIIPQHPFGYRQQIDFGRFKRQCRSETRIHYDTETAKGTSGAPCFDEKFRLVGMHNAAYRPHDIDLYNQAIRFDWIGKLLPCCPSPESDAQIWSASASGSKPILGRTRLINWIDRAMSVTALPTDQIFAAEGKVPKSGRNFSLEILREKLRERGDPVIELGTVQSPLPGTVQDVMATIISQLSLPRSVLANMPPEPAKDASDGSKKRATWASKEVPDWFERILAEHRQFTVSRVEEMRQQVKIGQAVLDARMKAEGREHGELYRLPSEQQAILDSGESEGIKRKRWDLVWIALRLRAGQQLSDPSLRDLLARLARSVEGSSAELGRLRWLFIETIPDFITILDPRAKEVLDPMLIGESEIRACWKGLADAAAYPYSDDDANVIAMLDFLPVVAANAPPEKRLPLFQSFMLTIGNAYRASQIQSRLGNA